MPFTSQLWQSWTGLSQCSVGLERMSNTTSARIAKMVVAEIELGRAGMPTQSGRQAGATTHIARQYSSAKHILRRVGPPSRAEQTLFRVGWDSIALISKTAPVAPMLQLARLT